MLRECLRQIESSARRASELTNQILTFAGHAKAIEEDLDIGALLAAHGEQVVLGLDVDLVGGESGHCKADPVVVFGGQLDVVGRVAAGIRTGGGLEGVDQAIEADRIAKERR